MGIDVKLGEKRKRRIPKRDAPFIFDCLRAGNFARAKATRANRHGRGGTVNDSLYLADIGLPRTVGLAVGVRNVLTEHYAFAAYTALCHIDTSCHTRGCIVYR